MTDAELIARLRELPTYSGDPKGPHWLPNQAADRIEALTKEREAAGAKLAKAVEALSPLSAIADAYDENELDGEARKLWGKNLEHENRTPLDEIEIFAGRGGKRLLTLEDAMKSRATLAEIKGESHE